MTASWKGGDFAISMDQTSSQPIRLKPVRTKKKKEKDSPMLLVRAPPPPRGYNPGRIANLATPKASVPVYSYVTVLMP